MAKKNEKTRTYLQVPLPQGRKSYRMTKRSWNGLNYVQTVDTGALSMEKNISTLEAPYLVPSQKHERLTSKYQHPISMFGFDDFLIVIYREEYDDISAIYVDYLKTDKDGDIEEKYTGTLKEKDATNDDDYPRCVVQFNVYDTPTDPVTGKYVKKLLIFPDKKSMDFEITEDNFEIKDMDVLVKEYFNDNEEEDGTYPPPESANHCYYYRNTYNQDVYRWCEYENEDGEFIQGWKVSIPPAMPDIKYAAVHLSRLFGVDDARVYASGFNDYTNWNLDTIDEYNESNAWCSPAQSNTKAGGKFTGITNFQGHIVCFKQDYMHEIYNTKNPFRIQDIYAEGTIDNRTIQDVDGKLIFVSKDGVKVYTGANPRVLSYELNIPEYRNACSGTDGRCYYLYFEDAERNKRMFTYDTYVAQWSEQSVEKTILNFANTKNGVYALYADGYVYRVDSGSYEHEWCCETDFITNETVNIKHIKKVQMLADVSPGAKFEVYILYDGAEYESCSQRICSGTGGGQKPIRVKLRNSANYGFKFHIKGTGYVKLYSLELLVESGGELYV